MQFKQTNTTRLIKTAEDLLGLTVTFFDKTGDLNKDGIIGFVMCQIFKKIRLYKNDNSEWIILIDCHDDVVKLMFDLQRYYFKYKLWNALQLTSVIQQRMYETLKQYEFAGTREISINEIRELLGIKKTSYTLWQNFKVRVLDASMAALASYTDIKFTWEVTEKRGKGGKISKIKFNIEKNTNFVQQLTFDDYLSVQELTEFEDDVKAFERPDDDDAIATASDDEIYESPMYSERIQFLSDACNNEFTKREIIVLYNLMLNKNHFSPVTDEIKCYNYLKHKYDYLKMRNEKEIIKNRFYYIKSLIENE